MAKELPYFRFTVQEWQNGDIALQSYKVKGIFIDVCSFYWIRNCDLHYEKLFRKFKDSKDGLNLLIDEGIIKIKNQMVFIDFLDEQKESLSALSNLRKEAGAKGGRKGSKWPDEARKKGNQFYVILMTHEDECFIKTGITGDSVSRRYSNLKPYKATVLYQYFSENNLLFIEESIESALKPYKPNYPFGGHRECFLVEELGKLEKIVENCTSEKNQIKSKAEAKIKQSASYKDKDKDKDKEKNKYMDFVFLLPAEYEALKKEYGESFTNQCLEILNNYKGANGKKYKSDYLAIKNWVISKLIKDTGTDPRKEKEYAEKLRRLRAAGYDG